MGTDSDSEGNLLLDGSNNRLVPICPYPRSGGTLGKSILICGKSHTTFPLGCLVGPDYLCLLATYSIMIVPGTLIFIFICPSYNLVFMLVGICLVLSTVLSLSLAACSDPGIIPKNYIDLETPAHSAEGERQSLCSQCNIYRPQGAKHCYDCNACILELDHHCPWTGKCIGKNNIKYFEAFLTSFSLLAFYLIAFSIYHYVTTTKLNT